MDTPPDALGLHSPALFALSVLLLNATPGVDLLFVTGRTLAGGVRQGLAAAAGISVGCVVHALLAAFGLATLLALSPWAFAALKLAGAAYLLWLGWGLLKSAGLGGDAVGRESLRPGEAAGTWGRTFRQGLLTNVLNPKVALFFLAFLPQFILPGAAHKTLAFLLLGGWFVLQSGLFLLALVAVAAQLRQLGVSPRLARWLNGLAGTLFIGLAAQLALADGPTAGAA
jgi:threonine/homoserine/homoserine lactone efflux protein